MEMALQVLGRRTSARRSAGRLANYLLLVAGGAAGGAAVALVLSGVGALTGLHTVRPYAAAVGTALIAFLTVRMPAREWGHRQVDRRSSFGVTRPRPLLFLWGVELGSGVSTVITQSSTFLFLLVACLSPWQLAGAAGALYGFARLASTWRGTLPGSDRQLTAPMTRYTERLTLHANLNAATVCAAAAVSITAAFAHAT